MTCWCSAARESAEDPMSTPTRCTSPRNSSSTHPSRRASQTGPTSWPPATTRRRGCSAPFATRTCPPTSTASCRRLPLRSAEERRSTRRPSVSTSGARRRGRGSVFRRNGPRRTGCISCGKCNIGCGYNAKNKLTTNYLHLAERLGVQIHELHEVHDLVPLEGGGFEVHTRHPGWAQRVGHRRRHTYTAEQVIVAAHAYGSAKLLLHMQHEGHLTGLSNVL